MKNQKKIRIGKCEYMICINENQEKYLYKYDSEYQIGIKLTFCNQEAENIKENIMKTLSNQYVQQILILKEM